MTHVGTQKSLANVEYRSVFCSCKCIGDGKHKTKQSEDLSGYTLLSCLTWSQPKTYLYPFQATEANLLVSLLLLPLFEVEVQLAPFCKTRGIFRCIMPMIIIIIQKHSVKETLRMIRASFEDCKDFSANTAQKEGDR